MRSDATWKLIYHSLFFYLVKFSFPCGRLNSSIFLLLNPNPSIQVLFSAIKINSKTYIYYTAYIGFTPIPNLEQTLYIFTYSQLLQILNDQQSFPYGDHRHKMINGLKEGEDGKKEDANDSKISTKPSSSTSSSWLRLKDPRIVRVSRGFGGKDRHSKVCTVRGLRDRRVRLSVPTAIQLYDLQDRLGLNQPSKVVDWLLNVAKDEIDELPPLPMPPLGFSRNLLQNNTYPQAAAQAVTSPQNGDWDNENPEDARGKSKEVKTDQKENSQYNNCLSLADFLNNPQGMPPQGSLYQWEANSNFPVPYISRFEDGHYNMSLPSTLMSLSSSYFPAASVHIPAGIDSRQMNQFQMLSSGASLVPNSPLYQPSMRPFQLSLSTSRPPDQSQNEQNKEQDLHQFPSE